MLTFILLAEGRKVDDQCGNKPKNEKKKIHEHTLGQPEIFKDEPV